MSSRNHLIIMAKHPTPGKAKTRLHPLLGPEGAALFHRQCVRRTLASCVDEPGITTEIRCEGASPETMRQLFGRGARYLPQCDGDLGARLLEAARQGFAAGHERLVFIGTDCPDLDRSVIRQAFRHLDDHDLVLGPAKDGGYYLLGLKQPHRELFEGIPWGGGEVLSMTMEKAERRGLSTAMLPPLMDIDTPEDLEVWARSCAPSGEASPRLSVIIPTLNEQFHLAATITSALWKCDVEIIVSDGGSRDCTQDIATRLGARVVLGPPSRGLQLNAGARVARGNTLLFLHADTLLPYGYFDAVHRILNSPETSLGAFTLHIDSPKIALRLVEWGVGLRSRLLGLPYGDQALFLKRTTFETCGGFPAWPQMEDFDLVRRLGRLGTVKISEHKVLTSARKWEKQGVWHTTFMHQRMIFKHAVTVGSGRSRETSEPAPLYTRKV